MSVILITKHNENIYDITKSIIPFQQKPPRFTKYKGKFHQTQRDFYKRCIKLHATMGMPEEVPPDPANYLKKHTGKPSYSACQPPRDDTPINKPPQDKVPTLKELQQEFRQPRISKNFIVHNIKKVTKMKVKEPEPRVVIDRCGTRKPLKAGLEPTFTKQPEFGKKPKYLVRFNKIRQQVTQLEKDKSVAEQPKCRYITKEERDKLLDGLKQNWEELQKQYQGLPILTDTIPKRNRRLKIEAELKQIEKDIVLVERHPYIYVYDDNDLS